MGRWGDAHLLRRLSLRRRAKRPLSLALITLVAVGVLAAIGGSPAAAVSCEDEFIAASGEQWGVAGNWSNGLPTAGTAVCWSGSRNGRRRQRVAGGGLDRERRFSHGQRGLAANSRAPRMPRRCPPATITGGTLELEGPATTVSFAFSGGTMKGFGSASLAVSGAISWSGGAIGDGSNFTHIAISQTGGGSFTIGGIGESRTVRRQQRQRDN